MLDNESFRGRSWVEKFRDAFCGMKDGVRGQSSFFVHFFCAGVVILAGGVLRIDTQSEWCLLLLCITLVLCAEMFNSALESLARAITDELNPHIATALNISSAAVLVASIGAALIGALIFVNRLGPMLAWW